MNSPRTTTTDADGPKQTTICPDCGSRHITDAPAESQMDWLCEDCGRTFIND